MMVRDWFSALCMYGHIDSLLLHSTIAPLQRKRYSIHSAQLHRRMPGAAQHEYISVEKGSCRDLGQRFRGAFIRYASRKTSEAPVLPPHLEHIGFGELYDFDVYRATAIELCGMSVFSFIHCSIIVTSLQQWGPKYAQIGAAVGHIFLLAFFIFSFAAASGAHFNPTITLATVTTGHTPLIRGIMYCTAQMVGAMIGTAVWASVFPDNSILFDFSNVGGSPVTSLSPYTAVSCTVGDANFSGVLIMEIFFSLHILYVAYGVAFDVRNSSVIPPTLSPWLVSSSLGLSLWASGSLIPGYNTASMNAAFCIVPALLEWEWHGKEGAYILGPMLACIFHAILYHLIPPHHTDLYREEAKVLREKSNIG